MPPAKFLEVGAGLRGRKTWELRPAVRGAADADGLRARVEACWPPLDSATCHVS